MSDSKRVTMRVEDELAYIELDCPGERVNTLSSAMIEEVAALLDALEQRDDVIGAVLLSKKDDFIVGFDIKEFAEFTEHPERMKVVGRKGHETMNRFDALGIPIVAAIHGNCLGGGLEVALACTARVASDSPRTKLGFPEVQLGLFPGGGGTQRLPRLIDLQLALAMILTAKNLDASRARKEGLVDDVVHPGILVQVAAELARELARKPKKRGGGFLEELVNDPVKAVAQTPARALIFNKARETTQKQSGGHYPAPLKAIDCIEIGLRDGMAAGIEAEIENFAELVTTDVSKNLRGIFFMKQGADKDEVVAADPLDVHKIGVLGAGLMGAGITQVLAYKDVPVRLKDRDHKGLGWGLNYCKDLFDKAVKRRKLTEPLADVKFGLISPTTTYAGLENCELVIEAVFEDKALKQRIIADLESHGHADQIIASNTSTIPITELSENAARPQNIVGMHFFSPVHKMPLLEIIKTDKTSEEAVATALAVGRKMGKTCIVVNDGPGFFTSRVIGAYINEAGWLLQEGAAIDAIDKAMRKWGFPVGPMKLIDEVGIDVGVKAAKTLEAAFGDRWDAPTTLRAIADDDRKGRKNGRGLYRWVDGEAKGPDASVYELIGQSATRTEFRQDVIQDRCWIAMLNECVYCLEEGIARSSRDIDLGVIFGLGFPPFRGGVLTHADSLGLDEVCRRANQLADSYGDRLRPAPLLQKKAADGKRFFNRGDA